MLYEILLAILATLLLVPALVLLIECGAASAVTDASVTGVGAHAPRPRVAIMIPAHNEALQIGATIQALRAELVPGDRLIVVADNCSDDTAAVVTAAAAADAAVSVLERNDPANVGKGFAISFGVAHLGADPPTVVVLVDADCRVEPGSIAALARTAERTGGPVQGEYLLSAPPGASPLNHVSALALLVRNRVRPRGLYRLGFPCLLTGSGMAFPWPILRDAPETRGCLVEDMVLGLELSLRGHAPTFCPEAQIRSELPDGRRSARRQRRRWEHGHLHTLVTFVPRLLAAGLRHLDGDLLALAADLLVPPQALLVSLQALVLAAAAIPLLASAPWFRAAPLQLAIGGLLATAAAVGVAWWRFGRGVVPAWALMAVPPYLAWKLPIYLHLLLTGRQRTWERTTRRGEGGDP